MTSEPTRARLMEILAATPGASTRAVAVALGVSESTAGYHLRRLVREGDARSQVVGRDRCWYGKGCALCPILRRAVPRLRRENVARVAQALTGMPVTVSDLSVACGLDRGSARWAAQELDRSFLTGRTAAGRVYVRDGADVCIRKGIAGEACDLWGTCAVSQAWRAALQHGARPPMARS